MAGYNENPMNLPRAKQCQLCVHFKGVSDAINEPVCLAFPWGIPEEYIWEDKMHNEIDPEQEGTTIYEIQ